MSIAHTTAELVSALGGISRLSTPQALPARCQIVQRCHALGVSPDALTVGQLLQWSNEAINTVPSIQTYPQERHP